MTIRGKDCVLEINTGTYGSPTWAEITCARDVNWTLSYDEADASCRADSYRTSVNIIGAVEVTGNALKDKGDASYTAFEAAALAGTTLDVRVSDGDPDTTGTNTLRFDGQIQNWQEGQPYEDLVTNDFTIKPTKTDNSILFATTA